jgi:hypothetical protein
MIVTSTPFLALQQANESDLKEMCLLNPEYVQNANKYGFL